MPINKDRLLEIVNRELKEHKNKKDKRYYFKLLSLQDYAQGKSKQYCINKYNIKRSTFYNWLKMLEKNIENIKYKDHPFKKLTHEQEEYIHTEVIRVPATEYGHIESDWNKRSLSKTIDKELDIKISETKAYSILKKYEYIKDSSYNKISEALTTDDEIWYILAFKAWKKTEKGLFPGNTSVYYMALNESERKVLIKDKKDRNFNCMDQFLKEIFNIYMDSSKKNNIVMSNTPVNRQMKNAIEYEVFNKDEYNIEVILYNLKDIDKNDKEQMFTINPLYELKYQILRVINSNKKYFINNITSVAKEQIKNVITKKYSLY